VALLRPFISVHSTLEALLNSFWNDLITVWLTSADELAKELRVIKAVVMMDKKNFFMTIRFVLF
jgi:hypothetical protein